MNKLAATLLALGAAGALTVTAIPVVLVNALASAARRRKQRSPRSRQ